MMDDLKRFRVWYDDFRDQQVKISETELNKDLGGSTVTVCDGKKHRQLITGAYDRLVSISLCDQTACSSWRKGTGLDVTEEVPNLCENWFTSDEDVDEKDFIPL